MGLGRRRSPHRPGGTGPCGALTYRLPGEDTDVEPDLRTGVGVVDDGPLFLSGRVRVTRADSGELETRNRVTLCRCGASVNKPFCDGSHRDAGFRDPGFRDPGKPAVPSGS